MYSTKKIKWKTNRKMVLLFLFSTLLSYNTILAQQDRDFKQTFKKAEAILLYSNAHDIALPMLLMLEQMDSDNSNIQYKIGVCYLNIPGRKTSSIPYLEKAVRNITNNYSYSYKERKAPKDALFYLGNAYHIAFRLDDAIQYYNKFRETLDKTEFYELDFINQEINSCNSAKKLMNTPVLFKIENLGDNINRFQINANPAVSGNRKVLVFTAKLGSNYKILYSVKEKEQWSDPKDITDEIEAGEDCQTSSLSYDGTTLFLFKENGGMADLFSSHYRDGKWNKIESLGRNINTKYWESNCCLSKDGKTLYFSSNRQDGYGGLDIYQSKLTSDGKWSKPKNLGNKINTPLLENNPFISEDDKKLYFSSQGHYNMGGFDLFYSEKAAGNRWTTPVNIGYPINSTDNDMFLVPVGKGDTIFISQFSDGGWMAGKNIYRIIFTDEIKLTEAILSGTIELGDGRQELDSSFLVVVKDSLHHKIIKTLLPDFQTRKFNVKLPSGSYELLISGDNYQSKQERITIPDDIRQESVSFITHLDLEAIASGEVFTSRLILFDFDKYSLTNTAMTELERLASIMKQYPSVEFEIIGNTDAIGSSNYNLALSRKRAVSVVDYLHSRGISKSRFKTRGVGEIKVVALNKKSDGTDLPEGRKYNRRVDIRLLSSDTNLVYKTEIYVPEYLKFDKELKYTILVIKVRKKLPDDYFSRYNIEELNYIQVNTANGEFFYTLGSFIHKTKAIKILGKLYDAGFSEARIVDDLELSEILGMESRKSNFLERMVEIDGIPIYTIQIYALINPPHSKAFKRVTDVRVFHGKDKFYRYTVGEYEGFTAAKNALKKIVAKDFKDAFIRPLSDL
ncbi:MAG: OmpA family protein [Bacteroidetes bacterium]|nr:OmpA family protein [Bacteroidota bacterium]